MQWALSILSFLFILSSIDLGAVFVYDDHDCCCWKAEKNSRYLWLGGAALLGAGAGAVAGYAASNGKRGHRGKEGKSIQPVLHANISFPLTIRTQLSATEERALTFVYEVYNPADHCMIRGTGTREEGEGLLLLIDRSYEKLLGNYRLVIEIIDCDNPDNTPFPLFDRVQISNEEAYADMDPDGSLVRAWKAGDTVTFNAPFFVRRAPKSTKGEEEAVSEDG